MDLMSDITENDISDEPLPPQPSQSTSNYKISFKKPTNSTPSQWRQRLQSKGLSSMSDSFKPESDSPESQNSFYSTDKSTGLKSFKDPSEKKLNYSGLSVEEQIHQENIEILSRMSVEEREIEKKELIDNLDPKVLKMLMARSIKKYGDSSKATDDPHLDSDLPMFETVEGSGGTWVGGNPEISMENGEGSPINSQSFLKPALKPSNPVNKINNENDNSLNKNSTFTSNKKIRFDTETKVIYLDQNEKVKKDESKNATKDTEEEEQEEWEDIQDLKDADNDNLGPYFEDATKADNQDSLHSIHFPRPTQPYEELDINDPNFNDKLYEKYFPDLPRNVRQLEWMKTPESKTPKNITYDSLKDVRFDFKGDIITDSNIDKYSNSNDGLYNHSKNPELPGYTLPELAHYLRSTFPGQCCIASRSLGRIMYKLGTLQYQIHEIGDEDKVNTEGNEGQFEIECWKLIHQLQIIDLLQNFASDREKNLSIKSYAIDALWLWKQANGDEKIKKFNKKEVDTDKNQ